MTFKSWLINIRKNKGLTQREFAKVVDISYVSLCNYETGEWKPGIRSINKLSDYSGVSVARIRKMISEEEKDENNK